MNFFRSDFWTDESGAITVDWVVLCAAAVGLAVAAVTSIQTGTADLGDNIGQYTASQGFFD